MSLGTIFVLLIIFGWIGFLIYKWAKKQKAKKAVIAAGGPPCGGGCSGCTAAANAVPGEPFECPSMKDFNITIADASSKTSFTGKATNASEEKECCCKKTADQELTDLLTKGSGSCCH